MRNYNSVLTRESTPVCTQELKQHQKDLMRAQHARSPERPPPSPSARASSKGSDVSPLMAMYTVPEEPQVRVIDGMVFD